MTANGIIWRHGPPLPADRPRTLPSLVAAACARAGSEVVLRDDSGDWTWPALEAAAARCAGAWAGTVQSRTVVAVDLPNGAAHLIAVLAAWRLGALAAPLATTLAPATRAALLTRLAPALVVRDAAALFAQRGPGRDWRPASEEDPCLVLSTSGSTGTPRLALLTHDNLCSQQAAFAALWPDVGPGDRIAGYLPWHHSFGALAERLWSLCRGACLSVVPGGGRDVEAFAATLRAVRPTRFLSVPKLHRLAQARDLLDPGCLRWAFTAGAPLPADCAAWYATRGVPVVEGWGLTETSPSATITTDGTHHPGLVGQPIPGVSVGVDGEGHVLVAGPGVMAGYLDTPAPALRNLPRIGRCLDSGDLGRWEPTGLRLLGRADATVKMANGEKADLGAIESWLEGRPGIHAAAVALTPDGGNLHGVLAAAPASASAAITAWNENAPAPWLRLTTYRAVHLMPSIGNGLLTASHKTARAALLAVGERDG